MCKTAQEILPLMRDKRSMKKDTILNHKNQLEVVKKMNKRKVVLVKKDCWCIYVLLIYIWPLWISKRVNPLNLKSSWHQVEWRKIDNSYRIQCNNFPTKSHHSFRNQHIFNFRYRVMYVSDVMKLMLATEDNTPCTYWAP